jgi:uncharacterized repeat protein (TIGR01451 family)
VTCQLGTIPRGGTVTVAIVVVAERLGTFTNAASVNGGEPDPSPENNADTATASSDLAILKLASPDFINVGGNVQYELLIRNNGPTMARNVRVGDLIPAGTSLVSATPSQGTCSGTTLVICELGDHANGSGPTIRSA